MNRLLKRSVGILKRSFKPRFITGYGLHGIEFDEEKYGKRFRVIDHTIRIVIMDGYGVRHEIRGRIDRLLSEAVEDSGLPFLHDDSIALEGQYAHHELYTEPIFGEGCSSMKTHVIILPEWYNKLHPPDIDERQVMEQQIDPSDLHATSRIANQIKLTRELDGLTVVIPDTHYDPNYDRS